MTTTMPAGEFSLPDPPRGQSDEGNWVTHLSVNGNVHFLVHHFGREDTTIYGGRLYIVPRPGTPSDHWQVPDLLIAFDVDSSLYYRSNGYVISEQGKPPDFVLEVASASTAARDLGSKRDHYAAFGIPEYWRFDETGGHYGDRHAGERLVDGVYEPVEIEQLAGDILQGRSDVLGLDIRWHDGRLEWYDPTAGRHIVTLEEERAGRLQAESRAAAAAERVRELEEELRRMRGS